MTSLRADLDDVSRDLRDRWSERYASYRGRDSFARRADHMCPVCGGLFYRPAQCRGTMDKGFHTIGVQTLPIVGCEPPLPRSFGLAIGGFGACAVNADKARVLLEAQLRRVLGGDTKKAAEMFERLRPYLEVEER